MVEQQQQHAEEEEYQQQQQQQQDKQQQQSPTNFWTRRSSRRQQRRSRQQTRRSFSTQGRLQGNTIPCHALVEQHMQCPTVVHNDARLWQSLPGTTTCPYKDDNDDAAEQTSIILTMEFEKKDQSTPSFDAITAHHPGATTTTTEDRKREKVEYAVRTTMAATAAQNAAGTTGHADLFPDSTHDRYQNYRIMAPNVSITKDVAVGIMAASEYSSSTTAPTVCGCNHERRRRQDGRVGARETRQDDSCHDDDRDDYHHHCLLHRARPANKNKTTFPSKNGSDNSDGQIGGHADDDDDDDSNAKSVDTIILKAHQSMRKMETKRQQEQRQEDQQFRVRYRNVPPITDFSPPPVFCRFPRRDDDGSGAKRVTATLAPEKEQQGRATPVEVDMPAAHTSKRYFSSGGRDRSYAGGGNDDATVGGNNNRREQPRPRFADIAVGRHLDGARRSHLMTLPLHHHNHHFVVCSRCHSTLTCRKSAVAVRCSVCTHCSPARFTSSS